MLPITSAPIENGTVACDNGVIQYVGPTASAPAGESVDLGDTLLLPGLINAHTHLELTAMRGFLEGLSFPEWIDTLRHARNTVLNDDALLDSARLGIAEGLERGITTYADTCSSGVVMQAMHEMGVRGIMYQETFGPDPKSVDLAHADLKARVDRLRPTETSLVKLGVSPHAPYTVSDDLYRITAQYAIEQGLPLAMHIAESQDEDDLVKVGEGEFARRFARRDISVAPRSRSPIELLASLGALPPGTLLIHVVRADTADIAIIADHNCTIAHCPTSNAKLGHGIAPLSDFLAAQIPVGLGSDSVASNNRMDILEEARLATLFQNARTGSPLAVRAETALELATISGARALGMDQAIGSLEVGKAADLCAFKLTAPCTIPAHNPVATAIYALGGNKAELVVVNGEHLVEGGELVSSVSHLCKSVNSLGKALATTRFGA